MDSYMEPQIHHHNQHQPNSGLLRFHSAPSSLFNEFTQSPTDSETRSGNDEFLESSYEMKPLRLSNSQNGYLGSGQLPPQYPKHHMGSSGSSSIQRSNSREIDQSIRQGGGGGGSNLSRQNSSHARFFNQLNNPQNGYTAMRGLGNFVVGNGTHGESTPHLSRLSLNHLPQISEITNESIEETSPDDVVKFRHREDAASFESPPRFPFASWNDSASDSSHLSKNGGLASRPNLLTHHLSLPKTSAEIAAVEKLFHFQDTVPCKVRAKRGCATHPRSIAERVRRNRISERIRKLQDLVPNMDKQTNAADMLDFAVVYIKNLQNQHKVLCDNRAKCKCVNLQHSGKLNQAV